MQGPPVSSGEKRTLVAWVKRAMVLVGAWFTHGLWVEVGIIRIAMIMLEHRCCIHAACGLSLAGVRGQTGRQRVEEVESRRSDGESVLGGDGASEEEMLLLSRGQYVH